MDLFLAKKLSHEYQHNPRLNPQQLAQEENGQLYELLMSSPDEESFWQQVILIEELLRNPKLVAVRLIKEATKEQMRQVSVIPPSQYQLPNNHE